MVLNTSDNVLESRAEAHRNRYGTAVPQIGDEFAGRLIARVRSAARS
nr:hypothetical protein [Actinacidiphila soli]